MKKITVWLAVLLCTLGLTVSVSAEDIFVMDWADLLTDAEESALNAFLGGISEEAGANIVAASGVCKFKFGIWSKSQDPSLYR